MWSFVLLVTSDKRVLCVQLRYTGPDPSGNKEPLPACVASKCQPPISDGVLGCSQTRAEKITDCISGLVAEYIVAIDVTGVRFPADAYVYLCNPCLWGAARARANDLPRT